MRLDAKSKLVVASATQKELKKYPMLTGNAVIVSRRVLNQGWFTSAVVHEMPTVVIPEPLKPGDLEEFATLKSLALDQNGIVPVGTRVAFRTPLVVGRKTPHSRLSPEEKVLRAIFGMKPSEFPDTLLVSELLDEAIVARADVRSVNDALEVDIDLLVKRPLYIGDVLEDNHGNHFVVAGFDDKGRLSSKWDNMDVLVHPKTSLRLTEPYEEQTNPDRPVRVVSHYSTIKFTKVIRELGEKANARFIGPYNMLTQAPTSVGPLAGQKVYADKLASLGYVENAREMLTIKCDAVEEREKVYESLIRGTSFPASGISETDIRFFTLLQACGFTAILDDNRIRITRTSDEKIREHSFGEVKTPETLEFRTFKPKKDGLMCEAIFGPIENYRCACKKLRGRAFEGKKCENCGVEVTTSRVRRSRFGYVTLPVPVVHPAFVDSLPSILGMTTSRVQAILKCEEVIETPEGELRGARAIEHLFRERSMDAQPFIMNVLPILPPDLRPMVPVEAGKFTANDLNDLYRRVISRSQRLAKLTELQAPRTILRNETRMTQEAVDAVMMNNILRGYNNRILRGLDGEIKSLVEGFFSKRCDYSAQAVCVPDPTLGEGTLGVPDTILCEIFRPMLYRALETLGVTTTIKQAHDLIEQPLLPSEVLAALDEVIRDYPLLATSSSAVAGFRIARRGGEAFCLNPCDAKKFGISFSGEHLTIHVPLSEEAKQEAITPPAPREDMTSTLSLLSLDKLVEHTLANEPIELGKLDQLVFTGKQ